MKINVRKQDVVWNYVGAIISLGINFIILPILLFFLDEDSFGLWALFQSIGGISVLFDFGFDPTLGRNIAYCWSGARVINKVGVKKIESESVDFYLFKTIIATCKYVYFVISLIVLAILGVGGTFYILYISRHMVGYGHIIAWAIYAIGIFLNLYFGYYISCLRGVGAVAEVNKAMIMGRIAQIALMIITLYWGKGLIGASASYLAYGVVFRIIAKNKFYNYSNIGLELSRVKGKIPKTEIVKMFRIIWYNAWRDGLVSASNFFANQATTIICSFYLSLTETGIFSMSVQLTSGIVTIAIAIFSAYQPTLQSCYTKREIKKVREILALVMVIYIVISGIGFICLWTIGIPIVKLIKPNIDISVTILFGIFIYQFILKFRNCYTSYLSSTNRVIYGKAFILSALFCVVLAVLFLESFDMNIWGLIWAQIISQMVYNAWKWPMMVHKELELSWKEMIRVGFGQIYGIIHRDKKN